MKKLSKLTALLLAGAMVLLLLTACSGGGNSGENTQAEAAYMKAVNAKRGSMQALDNDVALRAEANKQLEAVIKAGNYSGLASVKPIRNADGKITGMTTVVKCDYDETALEEFFTKYDFGNSNININAAGLWSKVGVVVRVVNNQTYIAVSVEFRNPFAD